MNKTLGNLAIAAVFCIIGTGGFPQEVQQPAAPVAPVSAQAAQAQAAQVQPVQAAPVQQVNPLAGLLTNRVKTKFENRLSYPRKTLIL